MGASVLIQSKYLQPFRDKNLLVSSTPFPSGHRAFPDGHIIAKPVSVKGNCLQGRSPSFFGEDEVELDAPTVFFHCDGSQWFVTVSESAPGPGPGDFRNSFESPEEAIADVLDYFFGDPARMNLFWD